MASASSIPADRQSMLLGMSGPTEGVLMPASAGAGNCDFARRPCIADQVEPACRSVHEGVAGLMRRAIRVIVLVVAGLLLLPYLLTPLYRIGHPVSTLMIWRRLSGAPMSRQWIDFAAIRSGAAALRDRVGGRQVLQPSRHRLGFAAGRDRRRRGRRGDARRLDHHPAGGEKPVPLAGAQHGPQGAGISAGAVDRSRCCPSSGSWKSI